MLTSSSPLALLKIKGLTKRFSQGQWWQKRFHIKALNGVDLALEKGKTVAVVGKSGSGKTTLALCIAMLCQADSGDMWFDGCDLFRLTKSEQSLVRPRIQLLFQDSVAALPAHFSAAEIIEEPLIIQRRYSAQERSELVCELMVKVGLSPGWTARLPRQLSGGQRQRLAIARALALQPSLLILDEPFNGLDLSVRGQIANLLLTLQADLSLTFLYISHDLELVRHFADSVAVMDRGRIVEHSSVTEIFPNPRHAVTQALVAN